MSLALSNALVLAADVPVVNELPFPAWTYGAFVFVVFLVGLAIILNLGKVPQRHDAVKGNDEEARFDYTVKK